MSKPNTSRVSAVGKANDDKLAKIMADREKKVLDSALDEGESLGLRSAWLACYRIHQALNNGNLERAEGAMECVVAIEKLIREAEAGR